MVICTIPTHKVSFAGGVQYPSFALFELNWLRWIKFLHLPFGFLEYPLLFNWYISVLNFINQYADGTWNCTFAPKTWALTSLLRRNPCHGSSVEINKLPMFSFPLDKFCRPWILLLSLVLLFLRRKISTNFLLFSVMKKDNMLSLLDNLYYGWIFWDWCSQCFWIPLHTTIHFYLVGLKGHLAVFLSRIEQFGAWH